MKNISRLALAALLVFAATAPVLADDKTDLHDKLVAGLKSAKSFQQTTILTATGAVITATAVLPDHAKLTMAAGGQTIDMVILGADMYQSTNGSAFKKSTTPPTVLAQFATVPDVAKILPDQTENNVTYGAYQATVPAQAGPMSLTCTFDKKTYRLAKCTGDQLTLTFSNYDDPKNVVEAPKDAK